MGHQHLFTCRLDQSALGNPYVPSRIQRSFNDEQPLLATAVHRNPFGDSITVDVSSHRGPGTVSIKHLIRLPPQKTILRLAGCPEEETNAE